MIKEKLIIKWSSNLNIKIIPQTRFEVCTTFLSSLNTKIIPQTRFEVCTTFLSLPWILKCPYLPNFSEKIIPLYFLIS
jgi:hypothetical protein